MMRILGADRYEDRGTHLIFPTICHNEDADSASMKLYFYKDKRIFVCYTNDGTMSIFKFLKAYYETRQIDYNWYDDVYQFILKCADHQEEEGLTVPVYSSPVERYNSEFTIPQLKEYNDCVLDCFERRYTPEWLNDNISPAAMDKYDIRYSIEQNKIIIPHRDVEGRLIGIRGRALNPAEVEEFGKYMPIKIENIWYQHPLSLNLYGLYYNKENIRRARICFLVESEKAVLQAESFSIPNCCVAVCGSQINQFQINLLLRYCQPQEIVICFDNEESGHDFTYFNKLMAFGQKYQRYCNFSFIYDRNNLTNKKDSPTDRGEEIFTELLRTRVKVR